MQTYGRVIFGIIAGVLASLFCFIAGVYLVSKTLGQGNNDQLAFAIGLYFIGKGFFVGPMLILTGLPALKRDGVVVRRVGE